MSNKQIKKKINESLKDIQNNLGATDEEIEYFRRILEIEDINEDQKNI